MTRKTINNLILGSLVALLFSAIPPAAFSLGVPGRATSTVVVRQFASDTNYPRGLKFGPDGYLYVAESGLGGNMSTVGLCTQVPPPVGPMLGGNNGRVSRIDPSGNLTTVADGFPSESSGVGDEQGVSDIEFFNGQLYALIAGGGCSHGHIDPAEANAVARVNSDGSHTMFANISDFVHNNETANPEPDDFEPDGTPYSMVAAKGSLFVVEPNHGQVIKIDSSGNMSRLADISAPFGHIVPTAMTYHGNLYVSNLGTFPITPGSSQIMKITPSGNISVVAQGLTTVLGLAFDANGNLYALEMSPAPGFPTPGTGRVVRVLEDGTLEPVVTGLSLPTAMTFGPDGKLYISNWGFGPPFGEILQVTFN
jgi:sugar lactone lactonase YvrE